MCISVDIFFVHCEPKSTFLSVAYMVEIKLTFFVFRIGIDWKLDLLRDWVFSYSPLSQNCCQYQTMTQLFILLVIGTILWNFYNTLIAL